jgi:hypothetical protein
LISAGEPEGWQRYKNADGGALEAAEKEAAEKLRSEQVWGRARVLLMP